MCSSDLVSVDESSISDIPGAKVLRKGDFIGVVAPKEWDAIKASQKLKVNWTQVGDPFVDMNQLYDHIRKAPVTKADANTKGEIDAAFAKAAKVIELQRIRGGMFEFLVACRFPWIEVGWSLDNYPIYFNTHTQCGGRVTVADIKFQQY